MAYKDGLDKTWDLFFSVIITWVRSIVFIATIAEISDIYDKIYWLNYEHDWCVCVRVVLRQPEQKTVKKRLSLENKARIKKNN